MSNTIYVYDNATGKLSYTIENGNASTARMLTDRGLYFFADSVQHSLTGTYVAKDEVTGQILGIKNILPMEYVQVDKTEVVGNGTDVATISNIVPGTTVSVVGTDFDFVSNSSTTNYFEVSANGYSLNPQENIVQVELSKYGYYNRSFIFSITSDVPE